MQKICVLILLSAYASIYEAVPQTKWSRPIRNPQGQLTRERRQFPFGEWIPLSQPCPTCRLLAEPLDAGLRGENIGLTPPRPPTVTRQIHGEGNFFQDESSILSVPPPPPSAIPRHPVPNTNGNFQFSSFGQQFNNPLPVPTQKIFPQAQPIQFLPQTFLSNQPLLVNGNQQIISGLNAQSNLFGHDQNQQQVNNVKVAGFNNEFKSQKIPENVVLEQNKRPVPPKQAFSNKPQPFTPQQQNQQTFVKQQTFHGQKQQSVNFANSILTPPPAPKNITQDIVIPGLDKEEIQLLYVPVETLRQRGTPQEQLLTQEPQNIQFYNRQNGLQRPANNVRPTEQSIITQAKGHFITQNGNNPAQGDNSPKVTSTQSFSTTVTPSTLLLQNLPFQQTPAPFVSATPATPTIQSFVTPASVFQKFSPFTHETTLSHLSTVPNTIQFTQSGIEFGTTPKAIVSQGTFTEGILNEKTQFSGLKAAGLSQQHGSQFSSQQEGITQQPELSTVFSQEPQKEVLNPTHFPQQIDQQQINLQKQQQEQLILQQQRQKELEEQRFLEQQRKQKELEEQRLLQQQQRQKELEQQRFLQKQKELEEQRQKELEQQRYFQKQRELEEQRLLQQRRQKELEQQRILQKQKELEEQRLLQQKQKELEEQRFLQEQRQKELENQRRLQLQKQKELEDKRRLQQKQKEDEARLIRFQQQQKELQQQRLLQQQQEEQQRELQQQKLQKQKQENLKKQQQFQLFQQQQKQSLSQQQGNRHVLPANDNLNFIPQLEKESEPEDQQLVPHQPPLSVFFKSQNGGEPRITDVLRELRSSNTITVLDQYFEKMPTVFVGPAGLIPPTGYGKFELPYLSNIESNRIERRIDRLPFFVAPLNFVPPPGYAKIPFPAPHVGSVVVSSESNPAMNLKSIEKGSSEGNSGSFPVVGPELPGLINNLDTITTTIKPTTFTPSLPQTTAQLRNRRPNNSLYKPQSRKPISRTRPTTTSKPEEEVTQPIQKAEVTKDAEGGFRKPFNRFLNRRRQQVKTTTEAPVKSQLDGKSLENRHYSVEVYHQEKNQLPRSQQKSDVIQEKPAEEEFNREFGHHADNIERITPGGQEVFEVHPTPNYSKISQTESEEHGSDAQDYSDVSLQSFEDGPLPTGSAKTITQELYRPNAINRAEELPSKTLSKADSTQSSGEFQSSIYDDVTPTKFSEISDASPTVGLVAHTDTPSEGQVSVESTPATGYEKQDVSSPRFDTTEIPRNQVSYTTDPASGEQHTKGFLDSNEQYTSAFAEISKPHHIPGFIDSSKRHHSSVYPTQEISVDLEAPFAQNQQPQGFEASSEVRPTNSAEISANKFTGSVSSNEQNLSGFGIQSSGNQQTVEISGSQVTPTSSDGQYTTDFSVNSQRPAENNRQYEDQRTGSFISLQDVHGTSNPSSSAFPSQATATDGGFPVISEQSQPKASPTLETVAEVTANPSVQTYTSVSEDLVSVSEQATDGHGQDVSEKLPNDYRLKLPNPSIVRVRTRVRGKSRGQVNFAASQTTTQPPFIRSTVENRHIENTEQEHTTRTSHFREYNPTKISKYNQFRGVKKPLRTTTEATTEHEQKANIYTVRPHRRPLNPSTVSTKRIRRPTTPLPSAEAATEAFGISTVETHSQPEHSDISPSGVSNDVYYEQSSLSPVKHKFRKHFGTAEQKSDVVPVYVSTSYPSATPTYSTYIQEANSEGLHVVQTEATLENSDKYPEWNPSDSGFDVSGIVLTTTRTTEQEEHQIEVEEPKKSQDSKKAFDPELEKKTGRRRIRVRVHKRPHENFETAESQNLRTVANILVPPTTTYKPNDESSYHQLAKNVDFSFGGQKLFGIRSREYFRKRLNLTQPEELTTGKEQPAAENVTSTDETTEGPSGPKILGFRRKSQKNEVESSQINETSDGDKIVRPKFRGFVRKIIKHGGANKEVDPEPNHFTENEEHEKQENGELHSRQQVRVNHGGFNHTGRVNGTRHKTFVRYVKKNKIRHQETESHQVSSSEDDQKEEQVLHQTTESITEEPQRTESRTTDDVKQEPKAESQFPVYQSTEETQTVESQQQDTTVETETQAQSSTHTTPTESGENLERSSHVFVKSSTPLSSTPSTGLYLTQRPKFYQTLRPVFQRTNGFQRTREPELTSSTTEQSVQEPQEKRNGFTRLKYGKPTGFGTTASDKSDETKKLTEQQLKNKNLHTLEVRKYLRTKTREGGFSQFSKNKFFTSEKTETTVPAKEQEREPEVTTTERSVENNSAELKTTQAVVAHTDPVEVENETTENNEESDELHASTTEVISSEEEGSEEEEETSSATSEPTTETVVPTTVYQTPSSTETPEVTEPKTTLQTTEAAEAQRTEFEPDIYRFSKHSFSFDESEQFTGTKNRAHVRNITTDIIENTASFSAPGVEKRPEIRVGTHRSDEGFTATTESQDVTEKEKTEAATTEIDGPEMTTDYPETTETGTTASTASVTNAKLAKILKTSTTTKISHETEICYRGKCIRTKSENPDEDLKLLVDSASTMKIAKKKRGT